jgi:hypothetical protein
VRSFLQHPRRPKGGRDPSVHVESLTTPVNVTDPADVEAYREVFRRLQAAAVTGEDARRLISEASRTREHAAGRALNTGVTVVALLALSDQGSPSYEPGTAAYLASVGIPAFACTPDAFPDLLALAIQGGDVAAWAQREELASR